MRDLTLAAAGILNRQIGGPSFQPPLPTGLSQIKELKNEQLMEPSEGADRYRRGVYVQVQRMFPLPMLKMFDVADANESCTRRERSNTPLQALTMLNAPAFFEAARHLARRIAIEGPGGTSERICHAFRVCLAREPDDHELSALERFFGQQLSLCAQDPKATSALIGEVRFPEGMHPAEAGAWIGVARTLLNLDEFITRE